MPDSGSATRQPGNVTHRCPRTLPLLPVSGPGPSPRAGLQAAWSGSPGVPAPGPARLTHRLSFRTRSPTMSTVPPANEGPTYSPAAPAPGPTTSAAWTRPSGQHPRACGYAPGASRRYGRARGCSPCASGRSLRWAETGVGQRRGEGLAAGCVSQPWHRRRLGLGDRCGDRPVPCRVSAASSLGAASTPHNGHLRR